MFPLGMGVRGAAAATAVSQFCAAAVFMYFLVQRSMLPGRMTSREDKEQIHANRWGVVKAILGANFAMVCKQGSLLLAWAYATAHATRIGHTHVATHQIALSCWLVFALILDGAAVSAQVLMSRSLGHLQKVRSLIWYMLQFAAVQRLVPMGIVLAAGPI